MEIAIRDGVIEKDFLSIDNERFLENYLSLDDSRLFQKIISGRQINASKLIINIENRNLMKRGFELDVTGLSDPILKSKIIRMKDQDFKRLEQILTEECGCEKDFILADLIKIENSLYKPSYDFIKEDKTPILIEFKNGEIKELDKVSPISSSQEPLIKFYVFCPKENKDRVGEVTGAVLKQIL